MGCCVLPLSVGGFGFAQRILDEHPACWAFWADCLHTVQQRHPAEGDQISSALSRGAPGRYLDAASSCRERLLDVSFEAPPWEDLQTQAARTGRRRTRGQTTREAQVARFVSTHTLGSFSRVDGSQGIQTLRWLGERDSGGPLQFTSQSASAAGAPQVCARRLAESPAKRQGVEDREEAHSSTVDGCAGPRAPRPPPTRVPVAPDELSSVAQEKVRGLEVAIAA